MNFQLICGLSLLTLSSLQNAKDCAVQSAAATSGSSWTKLELPPDTHQSGKSYFSRRLASGRLLFARRGGKPGECEYCPQSETWLTDDDDSNWKQASVFGECTDTHGITAPLHDPLQLADDGIPPHCYANIYALTKARDIAVLLPRMLAFRTSQPRSPPSAS